MHRLLLSGERPETLEDDIDVTDRGVQVEDAGKRLASEPPGDLRVGGDELVKIQLVLPRLHRVTLDETVGLVSTEPGVDQREQQAVAEDESMARGVVRMLAVGVDVVAVHDPVES